jgi:hypothetical protein
MCSFTDCGTRGAALIFALSWAAVLVPSTRSTPVALLICRKAMRSDDDDWIRGAIRRPQYSTTTSNTRRSRRAIYGVQAAAFRRRMAVASGEPACAMRCTAVFALFGIAPGEYHDSAGRRETSDIPSPMPPLPR